MNIMSGIFLTDSGPHFQDLIVSTYGSVIACRANPGVSPYRPPAMVLAAECDYAECDCSGRGMMLPQNDLPVSQVVFA